MRKTCFSLVFFPETKEGKSEVFVIFENSDITVFMTSFIFNDIFLYLVWLSYLEAQSERQW